MRESLASVEFLRYLTFSSLSPSIWRGCCECKRRDRYGKAASAAIYRWTANRVPVCGNMHLRVTNMQRCVLDTRILCHSCHRMRESLASVEFLRYLTFSSLSPSIWRGCCECKRRDRYGKAASAAIYRWTANRVPVCGNMHLRVTNMQRCVLDTHNHCFEPAGDYPFRNEHSGLVVIPTAYNSFAETDCSHSL